MQEKVLNISHHLTYQQLKRQVFLTNKTIFCDFSVNKAIKYSLMFK